MHSGAVCWSGHRMRLLSVLLPGSAAGLRRGGPASCRSATNTTPLYFPALPQHCVDDEEECEAEW